MPPRNIGTLSLDDLLRRRDISPIRFGLDNIVPVLQRDLATHNAITTDIVQQFAVVTTDARRRYGVSDTITFERADEFSRMHTKKVITSSVVEFPMDGFQAAIGWTADFFQQKTVADMAMTQIAVERGHLLNIRTRLQAAIYGAANFVFNDYRDTGIDLNVKRFVNADGAPIPDGPNGEVFDGTTHTHYLFSNGLTNVAAHALVQTVMEHHANPRPIIYINRADEAAWRALPDFKAYTDVRLTVPLEPAQPINRLNPYAVDNRAIGLFDAAEVWTKAWALSNYAVCLDQGDATPKPLVCRVRGATLRADGGTNPGGAGTSPLQVALTPVATNVLFPLQAEYMESEFGFGVWERTAGGILYHAGGAVAYVEPTVVAS